MSGADELLLSVSKAAERLGWTVGELVRRLNANEIVATGEWELGWRQSRLIAMRRRGAVWDRVAARRP